MGQPEFFPETYVKAAKEVALTFHQSRTSLDALAFSNDDYESELLLEALVAQRRFRTSFDWSVGGEARYVFRSLWNRARNLERMGQRRLVEMESLECAIEIVPDVSESMGRYEARSTLTALHRSVGDKRMTALFLLGTGGPSYAAKSMGVAKSTVLRYRDHSHKFLEKEERRAA